MAPLRIGPPDCGTSTTDIRGSCRPRRRVRRPTPANWRGWTPGWAHWAATGLAERDKLAAVMAVLHFVRGAAALDMEAGQVDGPNYPALLRRLMEADRFPALAAALEAGAFDDADGDHLAEFRSGLAQLLDGIAARIQAVTASPDCG